MSLTQKIRAALGGLLFVLSLAALLWNVVSFSPTVRVTPCLQCTKAEDGFGLNQLFMLQVSFPDRLRLGETAKIELRMTPPENPAGEWTPTGVQISALAALDIPHAFLTPNQGIQQRLLPGQTFVFEWTAQPDGTTHVLDGNLWLRLVFQPKDGGAGVEQLLSVQAVKMRVVSLFGLDQTMWRWIGGLGLIVSVILILPLLDRLFFRRQMKPSSHPSNDLDSL